VMSADLPAVGTADAAETGCAEDTGHGSIDWVAHGSSAGNPVMGWHAGVCCSQRLVPEASSSFPSPCAYCQLQ
jgi:hypothetical protein